MDEIDCCQEEEESSSGYELSQRLTDLPFPAEEVDDEISSDSDDGETEFEVQRRQNEKHNLTECSVLQLPIEILVLICRYVVTKSLDLPSMEKLGECCSHFYLLARDQALWHAACQRVWGETITKHPLLSWRSIYIDKPHVWTHGIYISRNSYVRTGDPNSISGVYRPYYIVEYCRYLRFFPNGKVFMLTSPNEPGKIVQKLEICEPKIQGLLVGVYNMHNEKKTKRLKTVIVSCSLKPKYTTKDYSGMRQKTSVTQVPTSECEYFVTLELSSTSSSRHFNKLTWLNYSCTTTYKNSGEQSTTVFNISEKYPPLFFSTVRGYNSISTSCL